MIILDTPTKALKLIKAFLNGVQKDIVYFTFLLLR